MKAGVYARPVYGFGKGSVWFLEREDPPSECGTRGWSSRPWEQFTLTTHPRRHLFAATCRVLVILRPAAWPAVLGDLNARGLARPCRGAALRA